MAEFLATVKSEYEKCSWRSRGDVRGLSVLPENRFGKMVDNEQSCLKTNKGETSGASLCLAATVVVLLLNVALTAVAASRAATFDGETIYEGDCGRVQRWLTGFKLLINALATAVLASSNYCMQHLSAPSRAEVDQAHVQRRWFDIGTPTIGNLRYMGWTRTVLWILLFLTSFPYHLLYNSAVFSSLASNAYAVVVVPQDISSGTSPTASESCFESLVGTNVSNIQQMYQANDFEILNKSACINEYGVPFLKNRRTLLLVTDNSSVSAPGLWAGVGNPPLGVDGTRDAFSWMCSELDENDLCEKSSVLNNSDNWAVSALPFAQQGLVAAARNGSFRFSGYNYTTAAEDPSLPPWVQQNIKIIGIAMSGWFPDPGNDSFSVLNGNDSSLGLNYLSLSNGPSFLSEITIQQSNSVCASEQNPDYEEAQLYQNQPYPIDHCLSQRVKERCRLMYSWQICIVAIAGNVIETFCILFTVWQKRTGLLLTVGDAIASFLNKPDSTTLCCSWMDQRAMKRFISRSKSRSKRTLLMAVFQKLWSGSAVKETDSQPSDVVRFGSLPSRKWWFQTTRRREWALFLFFFALCIWAAFICFQTSRDGIFDYIQKDDIHTLWSLGFGTTQPETLIRYLNTYNFLTMILLSNSPQLILSLLYYFSNRLLTRILCAAEYCSYSIHRKPLRVSRPEGVQRSTYFLSLPYRYSIPVMIVSAVLHWLLSRSIFYVRILQYDQSGVLDKTKTISTCGLSLMPMVFTIFLAGLALAILLGLGLRRFPTRIPLAGNCSLAISAACHPPPEDQNPALKPVMWGEVQLGDPSGEDEIWQRTELDDQSLTDETSNPLLSRNEDAVDPQMENIDDWETARQSYYKRNSEIPYFSFTSMEVKKPDPSKRYG
ncbi:hypothetical protein DTO271D3_3106 [Paecilomyces variotii]|nr:hypothetical protein DTO271D3_3106 [Paecilomyces variotii]